MSEERIRQINQRIMSTIITVMLAVCGWYLSSINTQIASLNDKLVETNLKTNELVIRMLKVEEAIDGVKTDARESSKRIGTLERITEAHERELNKK